MLGTLATALVCLTLGQTPGDVVFSNSRAQKVEPNFPESRRAEIRELLLFASQDQGETWNQVSKITADQREFSFAFPNDGSFWLRVAVVNRAGQQQPENLYKVQPNWKLVVDTLKPLARIASATRNANEVAVTWEIQENYPEWSTFRLEYLTAPGGPATPVNAVPGLTGSARFNPTSNGPLVVRLTLRDKAGNESTVTTDVAGREGFVANAAAPVSTPPIATPPTDFSSALAPPALPPVTAPANPPAIASAVAESLPSSAVDNSGASIPGSPNAAAYPPNPKPRTLTPPAPLAPVGGNRWAANVQAAYQAPVIQEAPIASTQFPIQQVQYQPPAPAPVPPRKPLPPLQYINSNEAVLDYMLSKVGPSGVGAVDIYLTHDDGQNWDHVATDPAVIGKTVGGNHQGIVELPGDGVYGFALIVKSQAQLKQEMASLDKKTKGPRPGDIPEIRVEVDTIPPSAELFPPRRDTSKTNALMLVWTAADKNLGANPVTLEWAERREGPWLPIANNVANSGKHSWQLPDRLPVQVFMRLRVKDLAGNEGVAVTPDPQLVDLSEPEGHLLSVTAPPRK